MTDAFRSLHDDRGRKRDWYCEDILTQKLKVDIIHQDDRVLAFHHPYPTAAIHAVVIPKNHVESLMAPEFADPQLLLSMARAVQEVARQLGLDRSGFRIEANAIAPGVTPHVHWHVMGPGVPPPPRESAKAGT
jgi:histidine triad (HIT) family protein